MNLLSGHIAYERLVDFVDDRLSRTEHARVQTHLTACSRCAAHMTSIAHALELMRTDDSQDAPSHVLSRAFRVMRTHRLTTSGAPARRRVIATLRLDSAWQPFAVGLRAGRSAGRQLVYDIGDDNDLEVRVEPSDGGWTVAGQLLGACTGGEIVVEGGPGEIVTTFNEFCEFSLPALPRGIYALILHLDEVDVEVPHLELRD